MQVSENPGKQFASIDLNLRAREFLAAVEEFLDPARAIEVFGQSASADLRAKVAEIIRDKHLLADAISRQVVAVLQEDTGAPDFSDRLEAAQNALKRELLTDLVKGFDQETIIQYPVEVNTGDDLAATPAPRLAGQPVIDTSTGSSTGADQDDYTLTPAKITLQKPGGTSYLSFIFNTNAPEKDKEIELDLRFRVQSIEHEIVKMDEDLFNKYEDSSWLTFLLPEELDREGDLGRVLIPIPLRSYPLSPSILRHRAKSDPDSEKTLSEVRNWEYVFTYEHPDVAQDTIFASTLYNQTPPEATGEDTNLLGIPAHPLFAPLMEFAEVYPDLLKDLQVLREADVSDQLIAVSAFADLVKRVANAWDSWVTARSTAVEALPAHDFKISEELFENGERKSPAVVRLQWESGQLPSTFPSLELSGYDPAESTVDTAASEVVYELTPAEGVGADLDTNLGESRFTDRTLAIPNLDLLDKQNAWASIRVVRNFELTGDKITNPAFIFQTPEVRFRTKVTPLLVNNERWDIAKEGTGTTLDEPKRQSLSAHLDDLFGILLPASTGETYDIRIGCHYAFAIARGNAFTVDLLTRLPVVLGMRFTLVKGGNMTSQLRELKKNLICSLATWQAENDPVRELGMFVFTLSLFSHLDSDLVNLPLLKIEHLGLRLEDIDGWGMDLSECTGG